VSWYWWLLLWAVVTFPVGLIAGHWISGDYGGDRYWGLDWEKPENFTETADKLRVPPPSKL
jgi:hypothetical protein